MKWQPKHSSLTIIAIGFGLLYFFFKKEWMLIPIGMALVGFMIGSIGEFIHLSWMMIAKILGYINSRVLLSILFFLILTPIAWIARMLKKTSIQLIPPEKNSMFTERNMTYSKKDILHPW